MPNKPKKKQGRNKGWGNLIPPKKGEIRNPNGRPKKELCLISLVKEEFETKMLDKNGIPTGMTKAQAFAKALINQACKGNATAIKELLDRIDGKVAEKIVMDANLNHEDRQQQRMLVDAAKSLDEATRQKLYEALTFATSRDIAGNA